jgi:uncharacterized membrane protein
MSFALYSVGFALVICGLTYGMYLMHIRTHWIVVVDIVLVGLGLLKGVQATRQKDPV